MAYGGNDWLALTQEPTLEPELAICDPHHHFWDSRSERVPYQRYLLHELAADVNCGHNVRSTVFIEARSMYRAGRAGGIASGRRGRVRPGFGSGQRHRSLWAVPRGCGHHRPRRFETGRSGQAGAGGAASRQPQPVSRQPAYGYVGTSIPRSATGKKQGVLATPEYRAGAKVLAGMGLSLDTGVCFPQLPELADFAKAIPNLTIILNHLGGLNRIGPYANRDDKFCQHGGAVLPR